MNLQKACICFLADIVTEFFYEEERENIFRSLMEIEDKVWT